MEQARLLVVDDDPRIRSALCRWLEHAGFGVDVAEDGYEAIQMCAEKSYDLVTMDLEMPGINGIETIPQVLTVQPGVPVLVLSAYHPRAFEALNAGATKLLRKPIRLADLEREIRATLDASEFLPAQSAG
jgi:two-component system, sensor histidine kinase